jgi:LCP family protein required for cell wall assembly
VTHQQRRVQRSARLIRRRRILVSLLAVLTLVLLVAGGGYLYARYRFDQIGRVHVNGLSTTTTTPTSENILLVGDNSRCTLAKYQSFYSKEKTHFGTCSEVGGGRSDVTMVLHLDPAKHTAYLLSLPRDLWLPMPGGHGLELRIDDALNSAERPYLHLPFGPTLLVKTIEEDLGIPINHYVELNFYTFEKVVNTLGGITIDFPTKLIDHYSGLDITHPGCQHLNGSQALALVRARHLYYYNPTTGSWDYDGTGDLGRIKRTHIFLRVLAEEVRKSALSNPLNANALLGSILPSLKVDQGFTLSDLVSLALAYRHVNPSTIPNTTLPVIIPNGTFIDQANPTNYQAPGSIVLPFQPNDLHQVEDFLGSSKPDLAKVSPSSFTVAVLNGTGTPGEAATVGSELHKLGYDVTATGNTTYAGTDSETVLWYKPGDILDAERILESMTGQVVMGEGTGNQAADVVVTTGSTFAVNPPPSSTSGSSAGSTSAPSATSASSPASPQTAAQQRVDNLASTNLWGATHSSKEFWWDPKACPGTNS